MKPGKHNAFQSVFMLLLVMLLFGPARAETGPNISEASLPNGIKVLMMENRKVPLVSFQVWYRAGSRNERFGRTGLAHVLEHLMFKGTKTVSGPAFTRKIEANGGEFNAFTSNDFAAYFETFSSDRVQVGIDLESDRMENLVFKDEEFDTERMVVVEERRLRTDDNPQALLMEQIEAAAYQAQPYHWPIIGWADDLARLVPGDAREFYNTWYAPANATIVVVGDFDPAVLLPKISAAFGNIPARSAPQMTRYKDPPQAGERRVRVDRESQVPAVMMAHHAPNVLENDNYALEIASAILSGGKSSRLHQSLVLDKNLAVEVSADYSPLTIDPTLFNVSATPLPGKDVAQVEAALEAELARMRSEPVGARELEKARNQVEAAYAFMEDSLFFQGMLLAQYEIVGGWRKKEEHIPGLRNVTAEDVRRVANKYLIPGNRTVGILVPLPGSSSEGIPPSPAPLGRRTIQ